jgi:hypothetical protein
MPNYSGPIVQSWNQTRDLVEKGLKQIDKSMRISTAQIVKVDDAWADLAKSRPIIIINNQNVNIQVINILHDIRRRMDKIDVALYREALLRIAKAPAEKKEVHEYIDGGL